MKSVELLDCDIIQDLLPSYNDKISSESTNKLVEKHLKQCKNCTNVFNSMNKDIDAKVFKNQDEQIDFLKGFRKDKILAIIKAVLIVIIVILAYIDAAYYIGKINFCFDINDISIEYESRYTQITEDNLHMQFTVYDKNFIPFIKEEYQKDNAMFIKFKKILDLARLGHYNISAFGVEIPENIDHVYLEDKNGSLREIWNREQGVLTDKI